MRRLVLLAVFSALVGVLMFFAGRLGGLRAQQGTRKAFTAILIRSVYTPDWQLVRSQYRIYAVRKDGSRVDAAMVELPDHQWVMDRSVIDLVARTRTAIMPESESISTYSLSDGTVEHYRSYSTQCSADPNAQHASILGYDTVRVQSDITFVPGHITHTEEWVAPALDCFPLRMRSLFGETGKPLTPNTSDVQLVIEGDPAPSLFAVPTSYVERSPSEEQAEYMRRFPGHSKFSDATARQFDEIYHSEHLDH